MMYLFGGREYASLPAFLAERVRRDIPVADSLPCAAIPPTCGWIAFIFVVVRVCLLLMLLAIPAIHQLRTARVGAGAFRLLWHIAASFQINKSLRNVSVPKAFMSVTFL
jgi:hypothetical protein